MSKYSETKVLLLKTVRKFPSMLSSTSWLILAIANDAGWFEIHRLCYHHTCSHTSSRNAHYSYAQDPNNHTKVCTATINLGQISRKLINFYL